MRLSTGAEMRVTGPTTECAVVCVNGGQSREVEGTVPNHGRTGVFLAKEILRLHHGNIHAGPGMEGTEILISVRSC